jgi:hypothetical protein
MKIFITIIYILGNLFTGIHANSDLCAFNITDLTFFQPRGFEITNTWGENGVLSMYEKSSGNGIDILIDTKTTEKRGFDDKILSTRNEWSESILGEEKLEVGGHIFRIKNASKIQPVDTIILIQKEGFIIEAYLMKTGVFSTHSAFEDSAVEILRSIEQGGSDETRAAECAFGVLYGSGSRY